MPAVLVFPKIQQGASVMNECCGVKMTGIGIALPDHVMSNADVADLLQARRATAVFTGRAHKDDPRLVQFDCDPLWIAERTGIKERRVAASHEATSDFAAAAVKMAIDEAGIIPDAIDFLLLATVTPDYLASPPTASIVQHKVGLPNASAFDMSVACSSFVAALEVAYCRIRSGCSKAGIVVGADLMTRIANPNDRSTLPLFGDAGAACVLEATSLAEDHFGPRNFFSGSDGSRASLIEVPAGGSRRPVSTHDIEDPFIQPHKLRMNGHEVFKEMVRLLSSKIIPDALAKAGVSLGEVDAIVFHQANSRMIAPVVEKLGYKGIVPMNIHLFGNTTSASIPLCLYDALKSGEIKQGMLVLLVAFGGGLTWAAALMRVGL